MSFRIKLQLGFGLITLIIILLGLYSSSKIEESTTLINEIYEKPLQAINFARSAQTGFTYMEVKIAYALINEDFSEEIIEEIDDTYEVLLEDLEIASERRVSSNSIEILNEINATIPQWIALKDEIIEQEGDFNELINLSDEIRELFESLIEFEAAAGFEFRLEAEEKSTQARSTNTIFMYIGVILSFIIALILSSFVMKPIKKCISIAQNIAKGNLENKISINRKDEFGQLFQAFHTMQHDLVEHIDGEKNSLIEQQVKEAVASQANEMQELGNNLRQGIGNKTTETENSLLSFRNNVNELTGAIDNFASQSTDILQNTQVLDDNMSTVAAAAEELSASVSTISEQASHSATMTGEAVDKANLANKTMDELVASADKIGEIISLIDDIAEQTNLLALNATIEAARAGEQGKGFAVVATEVKNLATQTASATSEITTQISEVQSVTDNAVKNIEDVVKTISGVKENIFIISEGMEGQKSATNEIATRAHNVAKETVEIAKNVSTIQTLANSASQVAINVSEETHNIVNQSSAIKSDIDTFITKLTD